MVETERELTAGAPAEQLARWSDQIEKARPQEVALPGPGGRRPDDPRGTQGQARKVGREPEPGRGRDGKTEEPRGAPPSHGEERRGTPLERYSELVPAELANLSPADRRHIHRLLRVEVSVPKEGEVRIRLPFLPNDAQGLCREETAYVTVYNTEPCTLSRATALGEQEQ